MKAKLVLMVLLLGAAALAADPEPYLKSAPMPFYPPLARQARIQGKVTVHFTINEQGDTSDVEAVTGHQMLRDAAIQNVQNWKFAWAHPCACHAKKEVTLVYSVTGEWLDEDGPAAVVKWFGKSPVTRIEIQAGGTSVQP
jgi:TonB family protein